MFDLMWLDVIWDRLGSIVVSDNVLMTLFVAPLVIAAERVFAASKVSFAHYRFGVLYFVVNAMLLGLLAPVVVYWTAAVLRLLGPGLIDLQDFGFGGVGGALLALLISTFILDFFYYWFHRTLHRSRWLWQMHLLHHSDENMNAMTAQRGHVFETLVSPFFITFPMAILFQLPALEIAILSLIPQAYHFLSHANLRLNYGPLWWLVISPDYHRIHHSIEPQHRDKNFTNWFPIWDILFGTLYRPERDERPQTGVAGTTVNSLWQAYTLPIRGWRRMIGRKRPERRPLESKDGSAVDTTQS